MAKEVKFLPEIKGTLRNHVVEVPQIIRQCGGIKIFGKRIKSLLFTTDVAIIRNTNADAIIAVYPFTPQPLITQALIMAADVPVFCGVGGGITQGKRVINLALDAEFKGAMGVVLNSPTKDEIVRKVRSTIDIPVVVTVVSENDDVAKRIEAGATIINVSIEEYQGIKDFMEKTKESAKEKGYVETLFNRRRYIPELKSNNYMVRQFGERAAMNTPIQGTAADIMKIAMIKVKEELENKNLKSKIVLQVHDEMMIEAPIEEAEIVKNIVKESMESAVTLKIPLIAEVSEAENWYECK